MKKTVLTALIGLSLMAQTVSAQTIDSVKFSNEPGGFTTSGSSLNNILAVEFLEKITYGYEEDRLEYAGIATAEDGEYSHPIKVYNPQGLYELKISDGMSDGVSRRYIYMSDKLSADGVNTDMPSDVEIGDRYSFETEVRNYTDENVDIYYMAAYYDDAGRLMSVDLNDISVIPGSENIGLSIEIPAIPNLSKIKAMLVDDEMHPLGGAVTSNVAAHNAIYVSNNVQSGDGSIENPFADVESALTLASNTEASDVIYLREGIYTEPISINGMKNVIISAYPGENVKFTNSLKLSSQDFNAVSDSDIYNRIPESVRDNVLEYDLTAAGIDGAGIIPKISYNNGDSPYDVLTIDGERCEIARYPNEGYTQVYNGTADETTMTFNYIYSRGENWLSAENMWVAGFWHNGWSVYSMPAEIVRVDEAIDSKVDHHYRITTYGSSGSILGGLPAGRFYVFNIPEEIDIPGEWFVDTDTNKLYVYAGDNFNNADIRFAYEDETMITVTDSKNIGITGLSFESIKGSAIYAEGSSTRIYDCNFENVARGCIQIYGTDSLISSNTIHSVGSSGIRVTGGNVATLTPSNTIIENNEIYDYANDYRVYTPAIGVAGVGMLIKHNKIYDAPHVAIQFSGNEHIIEYNHIRNVLKESGDAGAIYCGRNLLGNGNIIRYNYFDGFKRVSYVDEFGVTIRYSALADVVAVYLDDLFSGTTVYGNIMNNVDIGVLMGGGSNNIISNNIIMNKTYTKSYSISADSRGTDGRDVSNVITSAKSIPYTNELWSYKYPENLVSMSDENIGKPVNNTITNNVMYNHNTLEIDDNVSSYGTVADNTVFDSEPGFVDYANGNFNLEEDAQVYNIIPEFKEIPFNRIGLNR